MNQPTSRDLFAAVNKSVPLTRVKDLTVRRHGACLHSKSYVGSGVRWMTTTTLETPAGTKHRAVAWASMFNRAPHLVLHLDQPWDDSMEPPAETKIHVLQETGVVVKDWGYIDEWLQQVQGTVDMNASSVSRKISAEEAMRWNSYTQELMTDLSRDIQTVFDEETRQAYAMMCFGKMTM